MVSDGTAKNCQISNNNLQTSEQPQQVHLRLVQQVVFGTSPEERLNGMRNLVLATPFPDTQTGPRKQKPPNSQNVLVLPEMWPVGFFNFAGYRSFADNYFDDFHQLIDELSSSLNCWTFGGSAPYRRGDKYFNRSVVASPTGDHYYFDKLHLFTYQSREAEVLSRGSQLVAFNSPLGETGVLTCFDLRFPESFRALRQQGCQSFVLVAAWPKERIAHWKALLSARAIENQAWVIGVNGCGVDFGTELGGRSMIVSPDGTVVTELTNEPDSQFSTIQTGLTEEVRAQFPFYESTIPDLLGQLSTFPVARTA
jgi:predicted amidohydrolase